MASRAAEAAIDIDVPMDVVWRVDPPAGGASGRRTARFDYRFTGWLDRLHLVRAVRVQELEQAPGQSTRYRTREEFHGLLTAALPLSKVQDGFERHARALKSKAELLAGAVLVLSLLLCGCGARSALEVPPLDEECEPETTIMQVPITAPWLDTGIDVIAGQQLHITATGVVSYGVDPKQVTDADGGHYTGKKFFTTTVLPTTVVCSLTGKVGGTTAVDTGTLLLEGTPDNGPGFVGTSYDEMVPASGRLFLGFNDKKGAFGDNSGSFTVTITLSC